MTVTTFPRMIQMESARSCVSTLNALDLLSIVFFRQTSPQTMGIPPQLFHEGTATAAGIQVSSRGQEEADLHVLQPTHVPVTNRGLEGLS